jgi:hypothetical protein
MQKCACKVRKFHSNKVKAIEMNSEKLAKKLLPQKWK